MRPSQIRLLSLAVAVTFAGWSPAAAHERPATTPAARYLQETVETAFDLARSPVTAKSDEALVSMIEGAMDWPGLTRFAVGRYRADLDGPGMDAVKARLAERLSTLARNAGREWPRLSLAVHDLRIDAEGNRHILSTAIVPRFGEVEVEWTLLPVGGGHYRIADVGAFGLTLRQFLRGWVTSLIADRGGDPGAAFRPPSDPPPH